MKNDSVTRMQNEMIRNKQGIIKRYNRQAEEVQVNRRLDGETATHGDVESWNGTRG